MRMKVQRAIRGTVVEDFLRDQPEWADDVDVAVLDGRPQVILTAAASRALVEWSVETGRSSNPPKATALYHAIGKMDAAP